MSTSAFKEFMERLQRDGALKEELRAAGATVGISVDAAAALAARHGYQFTAEDVSSELSEQQLQAVAGGIGRTLTNTSPPSPLMYKDLMHKESVANLYLSPSGSLMVKL